MKMWAKQRLQTFAITECFFSARERRVLSQYKRTSAFCHGNLWDNNRASLKEIFEYFSLIRWKHLEQRSFSAVRSLEIKRNSDIYGHLSCGSEKLRHSGRNFRHSMKFLLFAIPLVEAFIKPISNELISKSSNQSPCSCPASNKVYPCESGWTYFDETDACYRIFFNAPFNTAESVCLAFGGHLTSIHSYKENHFVTELAKKGEEIDDCRQGIWIGLVRSNFWMSNKTDMWVWTDGTDIDFQAWEPAQPVNDGHLDCVLAYPDPFRDNRYAQAYQKWANDLCSLKVRSYVCKKMAFH
ncbi:unnamed protein product [Cylicocyclus nassatus]|uniref:C-type lectin domain-containing protein n=1 Tax=Cylicocyclus nassatus TaxID=53992 RepID=A0AA36H059_CYLNA|nr:unnamed protein product [Cylicocyclus nassatus]